MRIDAHQHFWHFDALRDAWITEEMNLLRRNFLPAHLQPELQAMNIQGCIAVQADPSEKETRFLCQLAEQHSFIRGVVGWTDLTAKDVSERLQAFRSNNRIKGFRHILQSESDRQFMLRPDFKRGMACLQDLGFTYDILIHADQLKFLPLLVEAFAEQKFVIDHLAKPNIKEGEITTWEKEIREVAQYPNVWCKVSGMTTEARWNSWTKNDLRPYLDVVVHAFGTKRLLFGSDWPVCLLAGSYAATYGVVADYFSAYSQAEQDAVFGNNAVAFYNL